MIVKERLREYVNSKLHFALSSRQIDIPTGGVSSFGSGMVMHYVSHVPGANAPVALHSNHNRAEHPPRTPVQLSLQGGGQPTPEQLNSAVEGNRKVNQILGHEGNAVPFFSDAGSAKKLAEMTGGEAKSVVMSPEKIYRQMQSGDYRGAQQPGSNSMTGVFSHPELGDYFRTQNHRRFIDHAQTASLATPGAGQIHEQVQNEPDNPLHRMVLADHLEDQGKHGLAEKVRATAPVHYRRKQEIIKFCRERLRFALGDSKTGRPLQAGDPVAMYTRDSSGQPSKVPGQGALAVKGPAVSTMPGMVKVNHEALGNFDFPSANLRHTDEIPGYNAGTPPVVQPNGLQPITQPKPKAVRPIAAGESLSTRNLPPATSHDFADVLTQQMTPAGKIEGIIGDRNMANVVRGHFNKWAGKNVPDSDIMDMMCVPRKHPGSSDHGIYFDKLRFSGQRGANGYYTDISDDETGYNYAHSNAIKTDPNTGEPYLYFDLVNHRGEEDASGNPTGKKEVSMPHVLYNAAMAAHRNGIKSIRLHAALGDSYVGGIAWPKLGFDANLKDVANGYKYEPKKMRQILSRVTAMKKSPVTFDVAHKNPEEYSLLDLLAHPTEYKRYFSPSKTYGGPDSAMRFPGAFNMEKAVFDTDPNSRSMKILTARLRKIEAAGGAQ